MLKKIILSSLLLVLATGFAWSQTPVISAKNAGTQCSGVTFFVVPVNGTDIVPAGTTYSWPSPIITGSITGAGAASNMTNISGTLSTTTIAAQGATAVYTVTPVNGGFTGSTFTVTVTVLPNATASDINTADTTICGGLKAFLVGSSSTIINPTYNWYSNATLTSLLGSGPTYTSNNLSGGTHFYAQVNGSNACPNKANNGKDINVTVTGLAADLVLPANASQLVCAGISPTSSIVFTSPGSGPSTV